MKTARFKSVVAKAGAPTSHLQLMPAAKDQVLQKAIDTQRVMSVNQALAGQRKDFGVVGYDPKTASQVLLFPKSLKAFSGSQIVGIDYSLLEEPAVGLPKDPTPRPQPKPRTARTEVLPLTGSAPTAPDKPTRAQAKHTSKTQPKGIREKPRPPKKAGLDRPDSVKVPALRRKLRAVLREWEKGHEVKASKMLSAVIEGLPQ